MSRSVQRYKPQKANDEQLLRDDIIRLAEQYGRYGYRKITALLKAEGWKVNHKRVERIWREEGLKVPKRQPKKGRLYLNDGSCIRLKPCWKNHVWSYDFVSDRLINGKKFKMLTVIDEYTRESLEIHTEHSLKADDVIAVLAKLFVQNGVPDYIRSDNGPEFTAQKVRDWLSKLMVKTAYITPGSPWENGYNERFNGILREEVLNREAFYTITEAKVIIEQWRNQYNQIRPHGSLGYKPPAPKTRVSNDTNINHIQCLKLDQHLGA